MKKISLFFSILVLISFNTGFSQSSTPTKDSSFKVNGIVSVTNNGFSFIPAFTLDAPAAMANVSISKNRLSLNLETRFALTGKPWATSYITRYKLLTNEKQELTIGLQFPATSYIKRNIIENGISNEIMEAQQSISPEINYSKVISKNMIVGLSYLRYHGIGNIMPKNGNYVATWFNLGNIPLGSKTNLSLNQQLFYLTIDELSGWYTAGNISIQKNKSPFSISSMFFKTIHANIGGKDANWNISLNYSF